MVQAAPAYPIIEILGSGTFGQVYLSRSPKDGHAVAVKVISTRNDISGPANAFKEVKLLRGLSHPNIVAFIDLLQQRSRFYIVMEFCSGGDLRDILQHANTTSTPLAEDRVGSIFVQIVLALHHCHHSISSEGTLVHRDLKPENVLITQDGQIKLADFGLSTLIRRDGEQAHSFVGTPGYLAPEVIAQKPYGREADVFSLGCMLFEMLTLILPDMQSLLEGKSVWSRTLTIVSPESRTLATSLLLISTVDRWTTTDILAFPLVACWLSKKVNIVNGDTGVTNHREQLLQRLEKVLDQRATELRAQSRRLGAREAELEAKVRKFTIRASKSPSAEPVSNITGGKGANQHNTRRKAGP